MIIKVRCNFPTLTGEPFQTIAQPRRLFQGMPLDGGRLIYKATLGIRIVEHGRIWTSGPGGVECKGEWPYTEN